MCDERRQRIIEWLANGETGLSSEAIALAALGAVKTQHGRVPYPHDPADLLRCVRLEQIVPGVLDDAAPLLTEHSMVWRELVLEWGYLAALLTAEVPDGRGHAPITYKAMQKVIDAGRRATASVHGTEDSRDA